MGAAELISGLTPAPPEYNIDWAAVEASPLAAYAGDLASTPQEKEYHGEGDVWTHTRMVCEALVSLPEYRSETPEGRELLFTGALLHDIGKCRTTRMEDGRWTSPSHTLAGESMARELLWRELGLCGDEVSARFREAVCALVRRHSYPQRALDREDPARYAVKIAEAGRLAPGFTLRRLCTLSRADALGRICADRENMVLSAGLCGELADEAGCLDSPYPFPSPRTGLEYMSGGGAGPDVPLFDDRWGPVIMLSGLPGTGKDTWAANNLPDLPVVSLDDVRARLGIPPEAPQGRVAEEARRMARELLRKKRPFIWNATDLTPETRGRALRLFHSYKAWVRIIYLETTLDECLRRNSARQRHVPEDVIFRMLQKLAPPTTSEARNVQWIFT